MKKHTAVLVAGHSHWGKSLTLKALTTGRLVRSQQLAGQNFFIRRMSNDDYTEGYRGFIDEYTASPSGNLLAAFCPHFEEADPRHSEYALTKLKSVYNVHIFVLKYQYGTTNSVTEEEFEVLRRFGTVDVFSNQNAEANERAAALLDFISTAFE